MASSNLNQYLEESAKKRNSISINVHDISPVTEEIARVVLTLNSLDVDPSDLYHEIASKFKNKVVPISGSFRKLQSPVLPAIHGFISRNNEVIAYTKDVQDRFRQTARNVMMDKSDESLWSLKETPSGKFLVREANSEISELVELAFTRQPRVPECANVVVPALEQGEVAAFIDTDLCEVDYGYVIASLNNGTHYEIASLGDTQSKRVPAELVVAAVHPNGEDRKAAPQVASANMMDKDAIKKYYAQLYSYAPLFNEKLVTAIDNIAVL